MKRVKNYFNFFRHAKAFVTKCFFVMAFITAFATTVQAQDMFGIANSNFGGTNGLSLNPSTFVDNRLMLDINLVTFGVTVDNDYVYIPKDSLKFFGFKHLVDVIENDGTTDLKNYHYNGKTKNANISTLLRGPSATFQIAKHWFAIQTNMRGAGSFSDIHFTIPKFALEKEGLHTESIDGNPFHRVNFDVPKFTIGGMVWGELGLTYGHVIVNNNASYLKGALTVKRLIGYASSYVRSEAGTSFSVAFDPNDQIYDVDGNGVINGQDSSLFHDGNGVLQINNANIKYGHAFTEKVSANPFDPDQINGHGWGFDFGFTYEFRPNYDKYKYSMDGQRIDDPNKNHYKLRIGASLLDVGKINFDKNSKAFDLAGGDATWVGWDTVKIKTVADFDERVSTEFSGTPNGNQRAARYDMGLPRAFSMQLDYCPVKYLYDNLTWKQRWTAFARLASTRWAPMFGSASKFATATLRSRATTRLRMSWRRAIGSRPGRS